MNEIDFIEWMQAHGAGYLGDDAAVIECTAPRGPMVVTTDMLLDGTHFDLAKHGARAVGRKAAACSLSDVAAMGCTPASAFCSVGLPADIPADAAKEMFLGLCEMCRAFDTEISGGDTTAWRSGGRLAISVTMIGWADGCTPLLRSGARPGDSIFVTGALGGSILGRHLNFEPRVPEGRYLAGRGDVHAMMDISDGLAIDLHRMLKQSHCGATLNACAVPVSDDAAALSKTSGKTPLEHALHDGEDFELLFTMPADRADDLLAAWPLGAALSCVGTIEKKPGLLLRGEDDTVRGLEPRGYVHRVGEGE